MFERYTERARRVIFFARYEACKAGSATIETEYLLLGLLREDKNLTHRFLHNASWVESIRSEIEQRSKPGPNFSVSLSLPLSEECKRILAYAAEEADRLQHRHVGTEHLLLGILREEKCAAAETLHNRGLRLEAVRADLEKLSNEGAHHRTASMPDNFPAKIPFLEIPEDGIDFQNVVTEVERSLIVQSLRRTNGNKKLAAKLLGLKRTTLIEKMFRIGLMDQGPEPPAPDDEAPFMNSEEWMVPDGTTAKRIAEAIWLPAYGAAAVAGQQPVDAALVRFRVWRVSAGPLFAFIRKRDGSILAMGQSKDAHV